MCGLFIHGSIIFWIKPVLTSSLITDTNYHFSFAQIANISYYLLRFLFYPSYLFKILNYIHGKHEYQLYILDIFKFTRLSLNENHNFDNINNVDNVKIDDTMTSNGVMRSFHMEGSRSEVVTQ